MADSPPFPSGNGDSLNNTLQRSARPDEAEVLRQFESVLKRMDLPADKVRILRNCSLEKKWALVCDQKMMNDGTDPSAYLDVLRTYIERKEKRKKYKIIGDMSSTQLLKHIEISLRTNSIDWVRKFLDESHNGLRYIIQYMYINRDCLVPVPPTLQNNHTSDQDISMDSYGSSPKLQRKFSFSKSSSKSQKNINMNEEDDIHICVLSLRAIMNNKYGFNMVFSDREAIYSLTRCILHPNLKTKALAIELLSAICLVNDGHELVVNAFTRFQREYNESSRFSTLFYFFRLPPEFHVEFMSSCLQLINVLVHSVEDCNYRVSLQYEFTILGLDDYLSILEQNECESLIAHRHSYQENFVDVQKLMDLSLELLKVKEKCDQLEHSLTLSRERNQQAAAEYFSYRARLEKQISDITTELNMNKQELSSKDKQLESTRQEISCLELRLKEITKLKETMESELRAIQSKPEEPKVKVQPPKPAERKLPPVSTSAPPPPPPPPGSSIPPVTGGPPPPPPPPPPMLGGPPPPPPLPNGFNAGFKPLDAQECKTLRRVLHPKNKLPQLTWTALNPNQVKGTIFMDLNDEKLHDKINFSFLEENFKMPDAHSISAVDSGQHSPAPSTGSSTTKESTTTLLSSKRLQNIAITRRKLARSVNDITIAVHRCDLTLFPAELVDILLPMVPNEEEITTFKEYALNNSDSYEALSPEDKFVAGLINIERLPFKLKIMSFMASFEESVRLLRPPLMNLTAASAALKDSTLFPKVLEVVLSFGNFLNGQRRGPAYGFKLSSLETLRVMKSPTDHKLTLLHAICHVVNEQFPELTKFPDELKCLDGATGVNLESIQFDVRQLENTFKMVLQEHEQRGSESPIALANFVNGAKKTMEELQSDVKLATETFSVCVEMFGENQRTQQPSVFFTYIANFVKGFHQCSVDLRERKAALERKHATELKTSKVLANNKQRNGALLDELNAKFSRQDAGGVTGKLNPSEIADGDFERLMNSIKGGYLADGPPVATRPKKSPSPLRKHQLESQLVNRERI
ncbi:hypothetical protein FO519_001672 [Halicephalobus sp. NKZ332]|nr:hypothetical protein FO519_001672 [Halicephalobus sp. NKZ332]